MQKNTLSYCGQLVQEADPDRFLISMFVNAQAREALWALFAFNHEISKTREVVSESTLGLIRLQWWRDALADIYAGKPVQAHEVLKPLAAAIVAYDLPQEDFDKLIYAREFDLEDVLPGNMGGLINYADFTTTPLLQLALKISGAEEDENIVRSIAVNYSLAKILRATSFYAHQCRCYFPEDLMKRHRVSRDDVFSYTKADEIKSIVREVHSSALGRVKGRSRILKASQALSDMYMKQIQNLDCDVYTPLVHRDPPFKVLRLFCKTMF